MTPRTNYSKWWQFQNWWVVDVSANIRMFTHSISINSASTSLCHSSKENALNFSRFYEDKWEIKRNEVVCSYWWWKSNLLCPFRVSSSLFFIGKGDIYGISLRNFALLTSSKGDPFSCEIWYYVGLTLSQVTLFYSIQEVSKQQHCKITIAQLLFAFMINELQRLLGRREKSM